MQQVLANHLRANRPSHAYLLYGDTSSHLQEVAQWFVGRLHVHPADQVWKDAMALRIEEVRAFIRNLWLRPLMSKRRVGVIEHADQLDVAAQNTLLKTLEEPPAYAILLLLVRNPATLLPTIRSRLQSIFLHRKVEKSVFPEHLERIDTVSYAKRIQLAKKLAEDRPKETLDQWLSVLEEQLGENPSLWEKVMKLLKARNLLETTVSSRAIFEDVFLQMGKKI